MSIMDMINSSSSRPPMTLDLPRNYMKPIDSSDLAAASEFEYLTGLSIPPGKAKEALVLYSESRLILPKQAQNRAKSFEEHGLQTQIHRNNSMLELKQKQIIISGKIVDNVAPWNEHFMLKKKFKKGKLNVQEAKKLFAMECHLQSKGVKEMVSNNLDISIKIKETNKLLASQ